MGKEQGIFAANDGWRARIAQATDLETLAQIDHDLEALGLEGRRWRIALLVRKRALQGIVVTGRQPQAARLTRAFAEKYGVSTPDGRRLHTYRLSTENFERLQRDLARHKTIADLRVGYTQGLFVLWASEWFRRCYRGGLRRWEDLTQALSLAGGGQAGQNTLREITRAGLKQWQRPVYSDSMTQYLATLAREGGFPTYAVVEGGQGWAKTILEAVVRRLMGAPAAGEAEALDLAKSQAGNLPGVFNDAEFIQLCADLALAIVQVRREFEPNAQAAGLPLAAWLGLNRPSWREALPISTGDAEADALVETLMQVEPVTGSIVRVERMLLRDGKDGPWREAARIGLDGEVSGGAMASVDGAFGRLRAFAAGPMARYLPGELALFDPPRLEDRFWSARSGRLVRGILPLPFACPVQLDLRAGDRSVARIELPGGKPRRGQLLVAALEEGVSDSPRALRVLGSGSGNYRQVEVFLQVPAEWTVSPIEGGSAVRLGPGVGETTIWRVGGGARLTDSQNDCYRVLCGQAADQTARIDILGDVPQWAEVAGAVDLFTGPPHISRNRPGELVLRRVGRHEWHPAPSSLPLGYYEIGWRQDGIMLDRRRVAVLPREAQVRTVYQATGAEYEIGGFGSVTISPAGDAPVMAVSSGKRWVPRSQAGVVYRFDARIEWPEGPHLTVSIAYPGEACIARWDGRVLPHRTFLTLADMRDLVAIDRADMTLLADLRDPHGTGRAEMSWSFSREMPLTAVADDIASLLLPASLDAEVVLDMNNAINTNWYVRQFPLELLEEGAGFVASAAIIDEGVELCGRAIADPLHEVCFGTYSLLSDANHRPVALPEWVTGDWLVFLRDGDRVLTRPRYQSVGEVRMEPVALLGQAMAHPAGPVQESALEAFIELAGSQAAEGAAALDELIKLTAGLRGLPPATFNVLKKLPLFPQLLARMAFRASETQRDAVMDLALALPFAWFTIPRVCWTEAGNVTGRAAIELLGALPDAPRYAMEMVERGKRALAEWQPLLEPVFWQTEAVPLTEAAQSFLRRARHRIPASGGTRYRSRLGGRLPDYFLRFDPQVLDVLDAPCAAALAVKGQWTPSAKEIRHLKLAARTFPTWFSEAFGASLKEQA